MNNLGQGEAILCGGCLAQMEPVKRPHAIDCRYRLGDKNPWDAQAVNEDAKKPEDSGTSQGSEQRSSSDVSEQMKRALTRADRWYGEQPAPQDPLIQAMAAQTAALQGLTEAIHRQADAIGQLIEAMSAPEEEDIRPAQSEYLSGG